MSEQPLIAVYDACVLYPAPLRDLLVRLGAQVCFALGGQMRFTANGSEMYSAIVLILRQSNWNERGN